MQPIFIAIHSHVVRLDPETGEELWRTELKRPLLSNEIINDIVVHDGLVVAYGSGVVYGLRPDDGEILWQNNLPGLGHGRASIARPV